MARTSRLKDNLRRGQSKVRSLYMLAGQNGLLLMLLVVPLAFTPLTLDRYSQIKWAILQLLIPFLLAAVLAFKRPVKSILKGPMMAPALLFVVSAFVSVFFAQNRPWAARSAVNLLYMLALMLACKLLVEARLDLRKVLVAVIIASTVVSLLGIIQYYGLFGQRRIPDSYGELQTPSTIGHNNFAAAFIIMAIPATFAALASTTWVWATVAYSASLFVQLYYLMITASRGAWTGCFVSSFFWAVWAFVLPALRHSKGPRRWPRKAITIVLPLLCVVVVLVIVTPSTRSLVLDKAASMINFNDKPVQFRLLTWRSTLSMIAEHPFGVGLDNYEMAYPKYRSPEEHRITGRFKKVQHTHNEYLQTTAELGVYGTVAFLFLIVSFFRAGIRTAKNAHARRERFMLQAVVVGQLAMLVHSLFSFPLHLPVTLMLFWVYCGLVAAPIHLKTGVAIAKNPVRRFAPALFFVALVLAILQLLASGLISEYHQSRGILLKKRAQYDQAAAQFQKAAKFCNSNFLNHYLASVCLRNIGKLDEAVEECLKSLSCNPNDRHSIFNLGALYSYMGRTDEAIKLWKRVLSLDPDYAQAYFNMGVVYERLGNNALAMSAYRNALRISPGMKEACHNLVGILGRMGKFAEARDALVHCLENVRDLGLQLHLARVYMSLGEIGNAQRTLIEARHLFGRDERIEGMLRELENED